MNYIINPVWFYLMSVVDDLKTLSIVSAVLSGVVAAGFLLASQIYFGEEKAKQEKLSKVSFALLVVSVMAAVFIPSKNTLMQIMVAKYATYDNASAAIQAVQNAADYIIESVQKLNGG